MPEAVKETVTEALPTEKKEVVEKPSEASSGTLPIDDKPETPATPVEGTKPEEDGMEADQPEVGAEQPNESSSKKENGSSDGAEVNGSKEDSPAESKEADEAPVAAAVPEEVAKTCEGSSSKSPGERKSVSFAESMNDEGAGKSKVVTPADEEEIIALAQKGKVQLALKEYEAAADLLGKACEAAAAAYGDTAEKCGDLYFDYGCALLECGKAENNLLGDGVKKEVEDEDEEEEILPQVIDKTKDEENEKMETEEEPVEEGKGSEDSSEGKKEKGERSEEEGEGVEKGDEEEGDEEGEDVEKGDEEEDDESSLKVAWEMFELAKLVYEKFGHKEKLVETYMKLGEVNFETGHTSAIEDMVKALHLQKELFPQKFRAISHSHFNIGLTLATFEKFDEAASHFKSSKELLEKRIKELEALATDEANEEIKEIKELLPEIDEKISDMLESKEEKLKEINSNGEGKSDAGDFKMDENKPVTNISHLVKRKRKLEDETAETSTNKKQPCEQIETEKEVMVEGSA